MRLIILFILFTTLSFGQKYNYNEIFVRNGLGNFEYIYITGVFEIRNDSIFLFNECMKIKRVVRIINEKEVPTGNYYTCTNGINEFNNFVDYIKSNEPSNLEKFYRSHYYLSNLSKFDMDEFGYWKTNSGVVYGTLKALISSLNEKELYTGEITRITVKTI